MYTDEEDSSIFFDEAPSKKMRLVSENGVYSELIGRRYIDPRTMNTVEIVSVRWENENVAVIKSLDADECFCLQFVMCMVGLYEKRNSVSALLERTFAVSLNTDQLVNILAQTLALCATPSTTLLDLYQQAAYIDNILDKMDAATTSANPYFIIKNSLFYSCIMSSLLVRALTLVKFRMNADNRDIQILAQEFAKPPFLAAMAKARWLEMGSKRVRLDPTNYPEVLPHLYPKGTDVTKGISNLPSGQIQPPQQAAKLCDTTLPDNTAPLQHQHQQQPMQQRGNEANISTPGIDHGVDFSLQQRLDNLRRIHGSQISGVLSTQTSFPEKPETSTVNVQTFRVETNAIFEASNFPFLGAASSNTTIAAVGTALGPAAAVGGLVSSAHCASGIPMLLDIGDAEELLTNVSLGF